MGDLYSEKKFIKNQIPLILLIIFFNFFLISMSGTIQAAPTGSVVINSGAETTNSRPVVLTLSAADAEASVTNMRFSWDNVTWYGWEIYSTTRNATIPNTTPGTYTIYVQFRDEAGNVSSVYPDSIIFDATPPTGSVVINSGAETTNSRPVVLILAASAHNGTVTNMRFSWDNVTWYGWETYSTTRNATIPSVTPGTYTIYVQFRDASGNVSSVYSDGIILDITPPTVTITSPVTGLISTNTPLLSYAVSEGNVVVKVDGVIVSKVSGNNLDALTNGPHTVRVESTDAANNTGFAEVSFTVNSACPNDLNAGDITPTITILTPVPSSTLQAQEVLVAGTYTGPDNTGISVNGVVAFISGNYFYANNVPLGTGENSLQAVATTPWGKTAVHTIIVTSLGASMLRVNASPRSGGLAPLTVKFNYAFSDRQNIQDITMDFDGNGAVDFETSNPNDPIQYTYSNPGIYLAQLTVTDTVGGSYSATYAVQTLDDPSMNTRFDSIFSHMNTALTCGDIGTALQHISLNSRARYTPVFQVLQSRFPEIVSSYSALQPSSFGVHYAEYAINRVINGVNRIFFIYFILDEDGVWRIDSM